MEGGSVEMECAANSNPQPNMYTLLKRQMGQVNEMNSTDRKMTLSNITRDTSLSCIAHNSIGTGQSDWLDLDVQCKRIYFLHCTWCSPTLNLVWDVYPFASCKLQPVPAWKKNNSHFSQMQMMCHSIITLTAATKKHLTINSNISIGPKPKVAEICWIKILLLTFPLHIKNRGPKQLSFSSPLTTETAAECRGKGGHL